MTVEELRVQIALGTLDLARIPHAEVLRMWSDPELRPLLEQQVVNEILKKRQDEYRTVYP